MLTSLTAALWLACAPLPPPPVTTACEGADQVRRTHDGLEVGRVPNACTTVRCEGADRVRRTSEGSRATNACVVSRCEGWDWVSRGSDGLERARVVRRCGPPQPVTPTPDVLRYGLSYR